MYDNASNIYNSLLAYYEQKYNGFLDKTKKSKCSKHNFSCLFLNNYEYGNYIDEKKLDKLPQLKGDEEKHHSLPSTSLSKGEKEAKGLKILTPNKLLTKLLILLAKIKAGNNPK